MAVRVEHLAALEALAPLGTIALLVEDEAAARLAKALPLRRTRCAESRRVIVALQHPTERVRICPQVRRRGGRLLLAVEILATEDEDQFVRGSSGGLGELHLADIMPLKEVIFCVNNTSDIRGIITASGKCTDAVAMAGMVSRHIKEIGSKVPFLCGECKGKPADSLSGKTWKIADRVRAGMRYSQWTSLVDCRLPRGS